MDEEELRALILGETSADEPAASGDGETAEDPVMEMVRRQLRRERPPTTQALYARARQLDDSVREMTLRQFHAKYPLQVKREEAAGRRPPSGRGGEREGAGSTHAAAGRAAGRRGLRDEVRAVLLDFARSVVSARGLDELAEAVAGVEGRVDAIVGLLGAEPSSG